MPLGEELDDTVFILSVKVAFETWSTIHFVRDQLRVEVFFLVFVQFEQNFAMY